MFKTKVHKTLPFPRVDTILLKDGIEMSYNEEPGDMEDCVPSLVPPRVFTQEVGQMTGGRGGYKYKGLLPQTQSRSIPDSKRLIVHQKSLFP